MTTLLRDTTADRRTTLSVDVAPGRALVRSTVAGDAGRPSLRAMLLDSGPGHARVALVPDGALLLAGDAIRLDVEVGPGASLELVEPAGTVAFDMRGEGATWDVRIDLAEDATLVWAGEPFVVAAGARVRRSTSVRVSAGSRLALRESLVLGRHGERGGVLEQAWSAYAPGDVPLVVERLLLDESAHRPGILGGQRALGSVVALGIPVADDVCVAGRLELEHGGTVWRWLAHEAHRAVPLEAWRAVLDAL